MAIVYFDSSAFVKLSVEEDGSDLAATLWDGCDVAVSSRLADPEVQVALAAAGRAHRLTAVDRRHAALAWEGYWAATRPVELTEKVAAQAGELAGRHSLRGTDAVHLGSFLAVNSTHAIFAVWDAGLRRGALLSGVHVVP